MPIDRALLVHGLAQTLDDTHFSWPERTRIAGKVRDSYVKNDGTRILITTDRISAFDRVLGTIPFKGQVLNQCAAFFFEETKHIAANHVLSVPDANVTVGRECRPIGLEFVVRAYLTGVTSTSIWTHYEKGQRSYCGHKLPESMKKNEALPQAILTPSTKALHADSAGGHDESISGEEAIRRGLVEREEYAAAEELVLQLFAHGQQLARSRGLILADTKYELGYDNHGTLTVLDEIHTPDSSRYWFLASYESRLAQGLEPESFDKEYVRRYLADLGFRGDGEIPKIPDEIRIGAAERYIFAVETLTGKPFVANLDTPLPRIENNLRQHNWI